MIIANRITVMNKSLIPLLGMFCLHGTVCAQSDPPLLRPEEKQAVDAQSATLNEALTPALTNSAKSTVRIWAGGQRVAYGTVIGDGHKVLTKWSEVAPERETLLVTSDGGKAQPAKVSGVYEDEDLAVLETGGPALTPVTWFHETPKLGAFLAATQPDGRPAGFGVVSVLERDLRDTDKAYLGVTGALEFNGKGVQIKELAPGSGAATAGLKPGDIILKVSDRPISGLLELKNSLSGLNPGTKVALQVKTSDGERKFDVTLGNRPNLPNFPNDRLQIMDHMGGDISRVRDSFGHVIQSDMTTQPDQIGGPVADLKGRVIGITVARAGRTSTYIMPSAAVENLLKKDPQNPSLAQVRLAEQAPAVIQRGLLRPPGQIIPNTPLDMRRHLEEMQRLMDYMREEMDKMENGR